ncbi:MAG: MoaD/ThiS family protein [Tepidisphaeraceae bacterium]
MHVRVKLFAILKDRAGTGDVSLELAEGANVIDAANQLAKRFPSLADFLPRVAYAVDQAYCPATTVLHDGDELALIPPVSGG